MSASQRRKGARLEREAAQFLRDSLLFPEAQRRACGEESQLDQGRDLKGTPGFCFQVAGGARPPVYEKLAEAARAAGPDDIGVAMLKRDRDGWTFHLSTEEFLALVRRLMILERNESHVQQPIGHGKTVLD